MKILNLHEIRILKSFAKKIRQIKVRSALHATSFAGQNFNSLVENAKIQMRHFGWFSNTVSIVKLHTFMFLTRLEVFYFLGIPRFNFWSTFPSESERLEKLTNVTRVAVKREISKSPEESLWFTMTTWTLEKAEMSAALKTRFAPSPPRTHIVWKLLKISHLNFNIFH